MTLSEFADTYSWTQSLDLGPHLLSLADELPAAESTSIGVLLRQLAVEIPAGVAANLLADAPADLTNVLRLRTALELIERVYPVIEVAESRRRTDELAERLTGEDFTEKPKPVEAASLPLGLDTEDGDKDDDTEAAPAPAAAELTPADAELAPGPDNHPAEPAEPKEPAAVFAPANPFSVTIKPAAAPETPEESHVHPDSEQ